MRRVPDFNTDMEKYGKLGEETFLKEYPNLDIKDVRDNSQYQNEDIDFVVNHKDKQIKVEVKTDTVAYATNNIVFEVVAHNSSGWGMISNADYIYEVLIDDNMKVVKTLLVNLGLWKQFIRSRKTPKKLVVLKETDTVNLLCNIDELHAFGAIIREKTYE